MTRILAWDTETHLIGPGRPFPRLVCGSFCQGGPGVVVDREETIRTVREALSDPGTVIVGHNLAFDLGVLSAADDSALPLIFEAAEAGRLRDTMLREILGDVARGRFRREILPDGSARPRTYDLAALARRRLGVHLKKDEFRLSYGYLDGVPVSAWPAGAIEYAALDASTTLAVYLHQWREEVATPPPERGAPPRDAADPLPCEVALVARAWWLALLSAHGLRTDGARVTALRAHIEREREAVAGSLRDAGILRADGSRDTRRIAELVAAAYAAEGREPPRTKGGAVAADEDALNEVSDPLLHDLAIFNKLGNVIQKDVPMFEKGMYAPIHARYSPVETSRTAASNPNTMNLKSSVTARCACRWLDADERPILCPLCKNKGKRDLTGGLGIRECIVPRPGKVFVQADFPGLELRTFSEWCIRRIGFSRMGETINGGRDVHTELAAIILGVSYDEVIARLAAADDQAEAARKLAKIANFGIPGGLGDAALASWSKGLGFILSEARCAELRRHFNRAWPEAAPFFQLARVEVRATADGAHFTCPISGWRRARVRFTATCNARFQTPGAAATGEAGYRIARACYVESASPLYGARPAWYVHDEFGLEVDDDPDTIHAAGRELTRHMREGANALLIHVPFTKIEAVAMRRWSKQAKPVFDSMGRLIPWEAS